MNTTITQDDDKVYLGAQLDFQGRDSVIEAAKKAPFFIRLMAETLYRDEAELRRILLELGADGFEAATLGADFMTCREKLLGIADLMKTAAGRVYVMLEQMEGAGEITTTDAIYDPLKKIIAGMKEDESQRVCKFAH